MNMIMILTSISIVGRLFYKNRNEQRLPSIWLLLIPIITTVILVLIIKTNITSNLLALASFLLVLINVIVFIINQKMVLKELEILSLKEQEFKDRVDYEEYALIKEENERMNILRHDYKEIVNGLSLVIAPDNEEAKRYIEQFYEKVDATRMIEYSDSKMFNVLLSQMKTKCSEQGITLSIDPINTRLSFIKDMDIVVIFSNLLNNAIDSCKHSEEKKIFLNISTVNDNFTVIQIENSCDEKPVVIEGRLRTHKSNAKLHGIGMSSIKRAIKAYSGHLDWKYDEQDRMFCVTIVINNSNIHTV